MEEQLKLSKRPRSAVLTKEVLLSRTKILTVKVRKGDLIKRLVPTPKVRMALFDWLLELPKLLATAYPYLRSHEGLSTKHIQKHDSVRRKFVDAEHIR